MNNKVKSEKYRNLSIAALVTGILGYSIILIPTLFSTIFPNIEMGILIWITIGVIFGICLPTAAIVCGSIDLKRIKAGRYSNKGKGLDITGIALGSVFILVALFFYISDMAESLF